MASAFYLGAGTWPDASAASRLGMASGRAQRETAGNASLEPCEVQRVVRKPLPDSGGRPTLGRPPASTLVLFSCSVSFALRKLRLLLPVDEPNFVERNNSWRWITRLACR